MRSEETHVLGLKVLERCFWSSLSAIDVLPMVNDFLLHQKFECRLWWRVGQEEEWGRKAILGTEMSDLYKP